MHQDPKGTLQKLASFGYKQIESFEGEMGMFWGMTPRDFSKYLEDLGMTLIASHCNIYEDFDRKAAEAAESGMQFLICPWLGASDQLDFYKEASRLFNRCGEICYNEGIYFGYHNHDYSFRKVEGEYPQDILIQYSTSDVIFELDIYWAITAGHDPIEWLKKYQPKWHLAHIKDRMNVPLDIKDASTVLGTGVIDFDPIFEIQDEIMLGYLMVEQEKFDGVTPMQAAEANAQYMKRKLRKEYEL